jgi:serine/threonine-protein kinase
LGELSGVEEDGRMEPGTVLAGRYVVGRRIGAGGMGMVHAGVDRVLERDVAIKTIPIGAGDAVALERFRREARAAAALDHRNVVTIHDAGAQGEVAYIVMELLPGPNLDALVSERGPLPEAQAVAIARQAAGGLAAAHAAGVVHRDIKPANIVFDSLGAARIVDFGIARLEQASGLTAAETVIGSAHYLSPEQVSGEPVDPRADLYALGCVLMTMLTGRPPFDAEHALAVAHQHLSAEAPRVSERRPEVSPSLDVLVHELLAKSPDERPASAADVVQRLAGLGSRSHDASAAAATTIAMPTTPATSALPVTPATSVLPTVPSASGAPVSPRTSVMPIAVGPEAGGRTRSSRPRRRSVSPVLVALAAMALVGLVGWVLLGGPDAEKPAASGQSSSAPSAAEKSSRTPEPTASPRPSPTPEDEQPESELGTSAAVAALRRAIELVGTVGGLEAKRVEDLGKRLDDLTRHLARDNQEQAEKKLEDLDKEVEDLAEKGELNEVGFRMIRAALEALEGTLKS